MQIRKYRPSDCRELAELFYDTVHTVNAGDYTKEQLDAWTTGHVDLEAWDRSFREHHTLVALEDGASGLGISTARDIWTVCTSTGAIRARAWQPPFATGWSRCARALSAPTHRLRRSLFLKKEGIGSSGSSRWNGRAWRSPIS